MKLSDIHTLLIVAVITIICLMLPGTGMPAHAQDSRRGFSSAHTPQNVPDSAVSRLQAQDDFRYANDPAYWNTANESGDSFLTAFISLTRHPVASIILYLLIGALVAFVAYHVVVANNLFIFSRSAKKKNSRNEDADILNEENLDARINEALDNNDRRLAIRYWYLKTLRLLNDKHLIQLHAGATNHDYIIQMKQTDQADAFASLTRIYEYVWYGEYQPGNEQYDTITGSFNRFISQQ